jgi:hypothetical protein
MAEEAFEIVKARHPHWEGLLKLSKTDNVVIHESHSTKGLFDLTDGKLTIFWEGCDAEKFIDVNGCFMHISLLDNKENFLVSDFDTGQISSKVTDTRLKSESHVYAAKLKKTAVITDATSAEFFFPRWKKYYGNLFGAQNLYLVTYQGKGRELFDDGVINIWELYTTYNDSLRAKVISELVATLLHTYDVVLRCDVDEFLVPDPTKFIDLSDYVEKNELPYVTARGVDLIELADDKPLENDKPILGFQRCYGQRAASLNKTCLTTIPLCWTPGFHATNVFPVFSDLYNFHLKWGDIKSRISWHEKMLEGLFPGSSEYEYFGIESAHLIEHQNYLASKSRVEGQSSDDFDRQFLATVSFNPAEKIYQGEFLIQDFLFLIDEAFHKKAENSF